MTFELPSRPEEGQGLDSVTGELAELLQTTLSPPARLDAVLPVFRRDKGEDGTLVGFRVEVRTPQDSRRLYVSLRWAGAERLREEVGRFERHRQVGVSFAEPLPPFRFDPEAGCLMTSFPFDRRLPRLPHLLTPRALVRMLDTEPAERERFARGWRVRKRKCRWNLLSYRPERRVVLHWELALRNDRTGEDRRRDLVARIHESPLEQDPRTHREIARAGVPAPELIAAPDPEIRVESFCQGRPVGLAELPAAPLVERTGELVACWHSSKTDIPLRTTSRKDLLTQVEQAAGHLVSAHDVDRKLFERGVAELRGDLAPRRDLCPLHGDLHPGQILERSDGPALLDWDRAGRGEPAQDLANLWVHVVGAGAEPGSPVLDALCRGYGRTRPLPTAEDMRWHRLAAALRLLELPYRRPVAVPHSWAEHLRQEIQGLLSTRTYSRETS